MNRIWKDYAQLILAIIITIGFFVLCYAIFMMEIPVINKDIGLIVIGVLAAKFSDIVSYFYGSSKGSSDKNEMLKNGGL